MILAIRQESGCERIMLGRGAAMRPDWRANPPDTQGGAVQEADFTEIMGWIRLFFDLRLAKEAQQ